MSDSRRLALTLVMKGVDGVTGMLKSVMGASDGAKGKLKALKAEYSAQRKELSQLKAKIAETGDADGALTAQQARLERQIAATTAKLNVQKQAVERLAKWKARGDAATEAGQKNIAAGTAMGLPLALAVKQAADFQDGMTDIQQKADLSARDTARLKTNIIAAAAAAKQLPESMRAGEDFLAGAGMDPRTAILMLRPIGRAATAYRAQIEDLSRASFAAVSNLKVPVNQVGLALDAMSKAGKDGNFEIADMAQYFPALTAQAQALGQKGVPVVADLAAALQIARTGAGDSASAATNVQDLLTKINASVTIKKFKEFGIDLPKAMKKAYAEGKTPLEAIAELTNKATKGDLSKVGQIFTNQEAASALRPLIQNLDEYRKIRAEALNAKGTIDADFALRSQNASVQARALIGNLQNLAIVAGDKLLPTAVALSDRVLRVTDSLFKWTSAHPMLTGVIVNGVAAIAGLNLVLGGARLAFGATIGPAIKLYNAMLWMQKVGVFARIWAAGSALMTAANGPFMASMWATAVSVWAVAWPILAVIAACVAVAAVIAGVVYAFTHWKQIQTIVGGVWKKLENFFGSINWLDVGKNVLLGLASGLIGGIPLLIMAMGKVAMAGVNYFKKVLGIKSPSRVFMAMGGHITAGLSRGIDNGAGDPIASARDMAARVAGAGGFKPRGGGAGASAYGGTGGGGVIIQIGAGAIVVHAAAGQSASDIGEAIKDALLGHAREKAARTRSAYEDDDA
ncbi:phage tail tape measure protein [Asticcacaulis solisilvae]|uniref:phage tail tape measure protein n=1 Tax=Asticcacaulis solisilvae TaxID=1217274 RepID=UPI003FD7C8AD